MTNIPESDLWMVEPTDWANLEAWTITDTNDNNGDVYSFSDLPTGANRLYFYNLDMDEYVMYIANGNEATQIAKRLNEWGRTAYNADPYWQEFNIVGNSNAPTAVENTLTNGNTGIKKLLRDGQLLILRDGKTYNVIGAEIK